MVYYIYGDESGNSCVAYFSIGLLIVDPGYNRIFEEEINKIKQKENYHFEVSYKKTTEARVKFYKKLIEYFFSKKELKFCATIVECKLYDFDRYSGKSITKDDLSYRVLYQNTVKYNVKKEIRDQSKVVLIVDRKDKTRPQDFRKYLMRQIPQLVDMQEVDSRNHNLIQLTDLLLGTINGSLNNVQNRSKRNLIREIQQRLDITNYREKNWYTKEKFDLWFWRPKIINPTIT